MCREGNRWSIGKGDEKELVLEVTVAVVVSFNPRL